MAESPAKIQLPFHNGAQAIPRRFRPARSILTVVGLVALLLIFAFTSGEGGPGGPPPPPPDHPMQNQEDQLHEAAKHPIAPHIPEPPKGSCNGMNCVAYSQYAGRASALCNALMIFETLHKTGSQADRVLLHNQDWKAGDKNYMGKLLSRAKEYQVKLVPVKIAPTHGDDWSWQETFTKLYAFSQTQYKRILALDPESVLLQQMDDLFDTPPAKLAATMAYWLSDIKLSTNVLLIEPNKVDFDRIMAAIARRMPNEYDTDIVNKLFGSEATLIPHRRNNLITGEFRSGNNHAAYLGEGVEWNATLALEEARFVHFSDWNGPKPWDRENPDDVKNAVVPCWKHPDAEKEDCSSRDAWLRIYRDYLKRRMAVCDGR
ncbi:glycosyltransferase family 8 protein [Myriangium duriaei CBS 260.36]|uniref:Glycosyltransferase family 8 protein n=1 Tax=Myriangium duriaei CBS 260.36 TaxID=1168546 RepID=A0A9P4J0P7_9PEZI|nr:glycosyltransferase family 8 protein [Myriangium duriaei CBS 260.36]